MLDMRTARTLVECPEPLLFGLWNSIKAVQIKVRLFFVINEFAQRLDINALI